MPKTKKFKLDKVEDANKEILFDIMDEEKVERFVVTFEGSGDDGQIEGSDLPDKILYRVVKGAKVSLGSVWSNGKRKEKYESNPTVQKMVDSICYKVLEELHDGWEINDGAWGEFIFDAKDRTVLLNFNERYTESKLYEHEF